MAEKRHDQDPDPLLPDPAQAGNERRVAVSEVGHIEQHRPRPPGGRARPVEGGRRAVVVTLLEFRGDHRRMREQVPEEELAAGAPRPDDEQVVVRGRGKSRLSRFARHHRPRLFLRPPPGTVLRRESPTANPHPRIPGPDPGLGAPAPSARRRHLRRPEFPGAAPPLTGPEAGVSTSSVARGAFRQVGDPRSRQGSHSDRAALPRKPAPVRRPAHPSARPGRRPAAASSPATARAAARPSRIA